MTLQKNIYVKCDELDNIPPLNKENWLYEIQLLKNLLRINAKVLQVGCMDGTRILALLKERADLIVTGLDVQKDLLDIAKQKIRKANVKVNLILADITKPLPSLSIGKFDYVLCLNNTLGYISDEQKAIDNMRKLGDKVILSVYGEKFTNELASEYFRSINLTVEKIDNNIFLTKELGNIKRYTKKEVEKWGGGIFDTPIGYLSVITT